MASDLRSGFQHTSNIKIVTDISYGDQHCPIRNSKTKTKNKQLDFKFYPSFFPQGIKVDSFPRLYIEFGGKLKVHLFHLFSYHILVPFGGEFRSQEIVNKWN